MSILSLGGGVRLHLPEYSWILSCSILTDHYLFLRLFKHSYHKVKCRAHSGRAWRSYKNEDSQKAGKCYFDIGFCKYRIT